MKPLLVLGWLAQLPAPAGAGALPSLLNDEPVLLLALKKGFNICFSAKL
jgi:hypothetical protein